MLFDSQLLVWVLGLAFVGLVVYRYRRWKMASAGQPADARSGRPAPLPVQDLFEDSLVGYLQIDTAGLVRNVNQQECKLRGLQADEILGKHYGDLAAPGMVVRARQEMNAKLARQGPLVPYEERLVRPDGALVVTEVHETYLLNQSGHPIGLRTARIDITERHRSAEAAEKSASELRALFQAFPDLFLQLNADGAVLECNGGNTKDPFLDPGKFQGRRVQDVLPPSAAEAVLDAIGRVRRTNALEVVEYSEDSQLGTESYECRILPLYWDCVIAVLRNITERRLAARKLEDNAQELKRKNEELESALTRAREATRLKSRFLANMTHEIRTPMNGVLGMTDLLLATSLDTEQRGYADSARQSGRLLLELLNDILDLANIESGVLKMERGSFSLAAALEEISALFTARARAKGLTYSFVLPPEIPVWVAADRNRLRQALSHLLSNAIKFTEHGQVGLAVALVKQTQDAVTLRFTVSDTGIGIARDQQHRLFQSFTQADESSGRKYEGAGVGLAIAKQIVELFGGEIGVRSEPNRGSTFWFTAVFGRATQPAASVAPALPATSPKPPVAAPSLREPTPAPPSPAASLHRLSKVLLAEDNKVNQRITMRLLEKLGVAADAVLNGREAVEALGKTDYDLVLMDCQMPEMDGFEATAVIRNKERHGRHTPICALTANSLEGDRERCLSAGMDDYMTKPVGLEQLQQTIHRWVTRS
jgi:PAS domain S-box-containing protein